jgi:hypothetical protein
MAWSCIVGISRDTQDRGKKERKSRLQNTDSLTIVKSSSRKYSPKQVHLARSIQPGTEPIPPLLSNVETRWKDSMNPKKRKNRRANRILQLASTNLCDQDRRQHMRLPARTQRQLQLGSGKSDCGTPHTKHRGNLCQGLD